MITMRVRIPELLEEHTPPWSAYRLAQESDGRISLSAAYRLQKARGRLRFLDAELLEALCDVLDVGPGELLEREGQPKRRARREG